jgi:hypothetical protein
MQGVKWAEGVVDNEHMCKKKSKSRLIFVAVFYVYIYFLSPIYTDRQGEKLDYYALLHDYKNIHISFNCRMLYLP